ncbi:porin family protein [Photobacterium sp. WH77]|uniref:outer membrane beta-barrel protein n=1 Tax=Photobacterium TaxID=657 RepID=UPI0013729E18|nr:MULTISPECIES: outer membrane beta-barrel protein [Photobacterium]MBV7264409.1 outer membrane beta-barrel protein [Photobacterium sp. WH24]MCG2838034.1 porin family protein [Photobacterium sp. WH77]MCG2845652.1 porin family protein [Photobacterium sp. WH80]NAW88382.1 outer membrane beta-barrel protein [Photobacterium halotolerans]
MKKLMLSAALALLSLPASAEILGLSVGANAGASRLEYDGNSDYGYEYGVNASYQVTSIFSVNAGLAIGSAEVDSKLSSAKNDIDYTSVPLTLQADIPLLVGSVYARAGTNYYDVDRKLSGVTHKDDGWGFAGGAGFVLGIIPLLDLTLGYEYRDMGDVDSNAILLSVGFGL